MKKIVFLITFLSAFAVCLSSHAATVDYTIESEYNPVASEIVTVITLSGDYGAENEYLKTTVAITDESKENGEKIKALKQTRLNNNGKLDFSFVIQADTGVYSLIVKPEGAAGIYKDEIRITDYSEDSKLLSSLYNKAATVDSITQVLDDSGKSLCLDKTVYVSLSDEKKAEFADEYIKGFESYSFSEYVEDFEKLSYKYGIGSGNTNIIKHILENIAEQTPIVNSQLYADYLLLEDKSAVYELISENAFTNDAQLTALFEEGIGVASLKNIKSKSDVKGILEKYNLFDTSDSEYHKYRATVEAYVFTNKSNAKTADDISELVRNGIQSAKSSVQQNQTSGGGGGGGGGSSSVRADGDSVMSPEYDIEFISNGIFIDVASSHWAYEAVNTLAEMEIISGRGDNKYFPGDNITRAEFIKIIVGVFKQEYGENEPFDDVSSSDWFYPYIVSAYAGGIIEGDGKLFNPDGKITRQDAFVILSRTMKLSSEKEAEFTDRSSISEYAVSHINALYTKGIIKGYEDNSLKPLGNITRAEAAQLVFNAMNL